MWLPVLAGVVALVCWLGVWFLVQEEEALVAEASSVSSSLPAHALRPDAPRVVTSNEVVEAEQRSTLADGLNRPDGTVVEDLRIVLGVLENYTSSLGEVPSGNNREITAALCGRNARSHAPLPSDHPAISAQGELRDRWGRPFVFHPISRLVMEVRSAGPDGLPHTEDDVVMANGLPPVWLKPQSE